MTSFDGFYLTRSHYSNNSSATLHDYSTGKIAWFTHRTKRGPWHNWTGKSAGAETDMLDELQSRVKEAGFSVEELICDKDSATNAYQGTNKVVSQGQTIYLVIWHIWRCQNFIRR